MKKTINTFFFICFFPFTLAAKYPKKEQLLIKQKQKIPVIKTAEKIPLKVLSESDTKKSRLVTFSPTITEKIITYTCHWYKPSPSTFYVSVNDQEIVRLNKKGKVEAHETRVALGPHNTIKVRYEWTFDKYCKRWHSEEREVEYSIPDNLNTLAINFDWAQEYRLTITEAQLLSWKNVKPVFTTK